MSNAKNNRVNSLWIEAWTRFFIFWKKHDYSESLLAVYVEYLLLVCNSAYLLDSPNAQREFEN